MVLTKKHKLNGINKEEIVKAISDNLLRYEKEIITAYLFGSFTSGKPFADIDVGILIRKVPDYILNYEIELECRLEKLITFKMDIRILNKAPISFVQDVIRHGRIIIDRDPNRRADFENNVLKQYFDFFRFRQRYLEDVIDAPV